MKKYDLFLYIFLVFIFIISILLNISLLDEGDLVKISVNGELKEEYPLYENNIIKVYGADDYNLELVIADDEVCVRNANCPDKLCEHTGTISKTNEAILCLPGKIVITIDSDEEPGFDSISR